MWNGDGINVGREYCSFEIKAVRKEAQERNSTYLEEFQGGVVENFSCKHSSPFK